MTHAAIALAFLSLAIANTSFARSVDAPPSTPGNFRATLYSNAGGELFWQRSTDDRGAVRGYEITRNGQSLGVRDALSFYDRSLEPGVPYTFTVAAIDNAGQRSTVAITTLGGGTTTQPSSGGGPAAPRTLRADVYSEHAAEIFWQRESAALALRYEIRRDGRVVGTTDGVSYYTDALAAGTDHAFEVIAIDRQGRRSSPSSIGLRTSGNAPPTSPVAGGPGAPAELRVDVYSKRSAELFWRREPAALALRYEIRRDGRVVGTTNGVSYYTTALAGGTDYAFEVIAIGRDGRRSVSSRIAVRTDGDAEPVASGPSAPANLRADAYSSTAAELFWDRAVMPGVNYEIRRDGRFVGTTDGTSFYDDGLTGDTTYRYEVVTLESGRRSNASTVEVSTSGFGRQPSFEVRELSGTSFYAQAAEFASGLFEFGSFSSFGFEDRQPLSTERPYFVQRETSVPFSSDPFVEGLTESVLIDIDATGTGTYGVVSRRRNCCTAVLVNDVATRTHDGTSVTWSGTQERYDSSSDVRLSTEFTTETRSAGERTRRQSGEIVWKSRARTLQDRPFEITYDVTTAVPTDASEGCAAVAGTIAYEAESRDLDSDVIVNFETTLTRREGDRYWSVRETTPDGDVLDEYLTESTPLVLFCDFPEL